MQCSSPITAAGPFRIFTGFPIKLYYKHLKRVTNIALEIIKVKQGKNE